MRAQDMALDFLNVIFFLLITVFAIFFFVLWGYFDNFVELLKNISPFALFGLGLIINLKIDKKRYEKRKKEGNLELVLRLNYMDKIKANLTMFGMPLLLCFLPLFFQGTVELLNLLQALTAFLVILFYRNSLFNKAEE